MNGWRHGQYHIYLSGNDEAALVLLPISLNYSWIRLRRTWEEQDTIEKIKDILNAGDWSF